MQKVVGSSPISRSLKRPAFAGLLCFWKREEGERKSRERPGSAFGPLSEGGTVLVPPYPSPALHGSSAAGDHTVETAHDPCAQCAVAAGLSLVCSPSSLSGRVIVGFGHPVGREAGALERGVGLDAAASLVQAQVDPALAGGVREFDGLSFGERMAAREQEPVRVPQHRVIGEPVVVIDDRTMTLDQCHVDETTAHKRECLLGICGAQRDATHDTRSPAGPGTPSRPPT